MSNLLETENLCKKFKNQNANDHISLRVKKNTVYGLLGPNGAGKSTLLKMITGMSNPTSGKIFFDGREMKRKDLQYVGALIESPPIYENLTARENLKVRTLLLGLPDSRIDEVLKMVELQDTGKKCAGKFSMGMKQRLGIAMALLNHPKLLILDEPMNGLDPIGIKDLRKMIRNLPVQGMTVVVSSHILNEIEQIADEVGIIVNGRLLYQKSLSKSQNLETLFMDIVEKEGALND